MTIWGKVRSFVSTNSFYFVFIPSFIGLHYAWLKIQMIDEFVSPEERNLEQPIVRAFRAFKDEVVLRMSEKPEESSSPTDGKTVKKEKH